MPYFALPAWRVGRSMVTAPCRHDLARAGGDRVGAARHWRRRGRERGGGAAVGRAARDETRLALRVSRCTAAAAAGPNRRRWHSLAALTAPLPAASGYWPSPRSTRCERRSSSGANHLPAVPPAQGAAQRSTALFNNAHCSTSCVAQVFGRLLGPSDRRVNPDQRALLPAPTGQIRNCSRAARQCSI